ncbi:MULTISPECIES: NAD-dependent epimerase/dehydratase family protein [Burkholderia]|nr:MULTISPECIES: SDR family oxidoreductase [Burkholderia]MCU9952097.1 SDR family oxidoreductase [Burkholderia sp. BKH01]
MRVLVTGGAGYIGSRLIPALLANGHDVTVYDACVFGGDTLDAHPSLRMIIGDIRDVRRVRDAIRGQQAVIHLAFLSNDPGFRLSPALCEDVNLGGFKVVLDVALSCGVERFVLASSCSVYGATERQGDEVDERCEPNPLTDYAVHKVACERLLFDADRCGFYPIGVRAATVCGYARRQRLDLTFNRFATDGCVARRIVVRGGDRYRPFIALADLVTLYTRLLEIPAEAAAGRVFNAAYGNRTLADSAHAIAGHIGADVTVGMADDENHDARSYRVSSRRVEATLGFRPRLSLVDAAQEVTAAIARGWLVDPQSNPAYRNLIPQQRHDWSRGRFAHG